MNSIITFMKALRGVSSKKLENFIGERDASLDFKDKDGESTLKTPNHVRHQKEFNLQDEIEYLKFGQKTLEELCKYELPTIPELASLSEQHGIEKEMAKGNFICFSGLGNSKFIYNKSTNHFFVLHTTQDGKSFIGTHYSPSQKIDYVVRKLRRVCLGLNKGADIIGHRHSSAVKKVQGPNIFRTSAFPLPIQQRIPFMKQKLEYGLVL